MEIKERCNAIEECYEFMLGYAAQGLASDRDSRSGEKIREFLSGAVNALNGLAQGCVAEARDAGLEPVEKYQAFFDVLNRDARDSLAAIELVLVQPSISSQLVDNLNASIHVRALLTDLFLVDELLKSQHQAACIESVRSA
jgi:hypothetical protein